MWIHRRRHGDEICLRVIEVFQFIFWWEMYERATWKIAEKGYNERLHSSLDNVLLTVSNVCNKCWSLHSTRQHEYAYGWCNEHVSDLNNTIVGRGRGSVHTTRYTLCNVMHTMCDVALCNVFCLSSYCFQSFSKWQTNKGKLLKLSTFSWSIELTDRISVCFLL